MVEFVFTAKDVFVWIVTIALIILVGIKAVAWENIRDILEALIYIYLGVKIGDYFYWRKEKQ